MPKHENNLIVRPDANRALVPLRHTGQGYSHDLAAFIGERLDRPINHQLVDRFFKPLSDGSIVAAAHSVAARTNGLHVSHFEDDWPKGGTERFRHESGISSPLLAELDQRRLQLIKQGQEIELQVFDREMTLAEIESMLEQGSIGKERMLEQNRIGLVSLDWKIITESPRFLHKLEGTLDKHLLEPALKQAPFLYPLVPIVGYDPENVHLELYSNRIALAKAIFEKARKSPRAEPVFIFIFSSKSNSEAKDTTETAMEKSAPLDTEQILQKYRIAQRREQRENWAEIVESYCDNHEPCETVLDKAKIYGLPHQVMDELFNFVLHDGQARYPVLLYKVAKTIEKAELEGIPTKDFAQGLLDSIGHIRQQREKSITTEKPINEHEMLDRFENLFVKSIDTIVAYEGVGTPRLADVLRYRMMDLKLIAGPEVKSTPAQAREVPKLPAPFPPIDFSMRDPTQFKAVHPPHPGEPECVTELRILLEWLEEHGGEQLRNCLVQALGKGSVRIGNAEEDIFTTPLHRIAAAIRQKMGGITYFVNELCLNHGLSAWELVSNYDAAVEAAGGALPELLPESGHAADYLTRHRWEFAGGGLRQNINEVNAAPLSFRAELEFLGEILPYMLAGRVHPGMGEVIVRQFRRGDHRYSDWEGQRIIDSMAETKRYLKLLIDGDITNSHEKLWAACKAIKDSEVQKKLSGYLTESLSAQTPQSFKTAWKKMVQALRPDITNDSAEVVELGRLFIEYALGRKRELNAKFEAASAT